MSPKELDSDLDNLIDANLLGSGTTDGSKFLRDDQVWSTVPVPQSGVDFDPAGTDNSTNELTVDELAAVNGSATPSSSNVFATMADVGGTTLEYMYPIWAEENSALGNNTYEWAFGNGANTGSNNGIAIYVPTGWAATIVAMSCTTNNAAGSSVIEANINGVLQGSLCNVTNAGRSATNDSFTPVALNNADRLTFRTTTAGTNSSPNTVVAWIRMVSNV